MRGALRLAASAAIDPDVFVKQSEVLAALSLVEDPSRGEAVTTLGAVKELVIEKDAGAVSFNVELGAPDLKGTVKAKCEEFVGLLPWVKSVRYGIDPRFARHFYLSRGAHARLIYCGLTAVSQ